MVLKSVAWAIKNVNCFPGSLPCTQEVFMLINLFFSFDLFYLVGGGLCQQSKRVKKNLFFLPYSKHKGHQGLHCEGQGLSWERLSPKPHPRLPWRFLCAEAKHWINQMLLFLSNFKAMWLYRHSFYLYCKCFFYETWCGVGTVRM